VMKEIEQVKPHCIWIICRFAIFLKRIVNNENEGFMQYEKAVDLYRRILSQNMLIMNGTSGSGSNRGGFGGSINEQSTFGDNSACAILMMSLQIDQVGTIIHTNDEIYRVLGHTRKSLIGT
jgi:hypothetical protein